jgi:hypothetical protein
MKAGFVLPVFGPNDGIAGLSVEDSEGWGQVLIAAIVKSGKPQYW